MFIDYVYIEIYTLYALYYCPNTTRMTHLKIKEISFLSSVHVISNFILKKE